MSRRSIEKFISKKANEVNVPDVQNEILQNYGYEKTSSVFEVKKRVSRWWMMVPTMFMAMALICFSIVGFQGIKLHNQEKDYARVKDIDKVQSIYAFQTAVLTTLLSNPESILNNEGELTNALSDSVGFMDVVMNLDSADVSLYKCDDKKYNYYLLTNLGNDKYCKFYYNEQNIVDQESLKSTLISGYLEIGDSEFNIQGQAKQNEVGAYTTDLMLGYSNDAMLCVSSDDSLKNMVEYRLYNNKNIVKTVNLRFNETGVCMNVSYKEELYKFNIQGTEDHFSGDYSTGEDESGSIDININTDTYYFNVDDKQTTAERYIMP